ncbi:MAG: hypothetical protein QOJ09_715, partial [Actinomycetota bacterium]|nr:hypothetical protein [Actinomycetota bacterium]
MGFVRPKPPEGRPPFTRILGAPQAFGFIDATLEFLGAGPQPDGGATRMGFVMPTPARR